VIGTSCQREYGHFSLGEDVPYVLEHARCLVVLWREPLARGQGRQNRFGGGRQSVGILSGV
jgi:hypothetical protein